MPDHRRGRDQFRGIAKRTTITHAQALRPPIHGWYLARLPDRRTHHDRCHLRRAAPAARTYRIDPSMLMRSRGGASPTAASCGIFQPKKWAQTRRARACTPCAVIYSSAPKSTFGVGTSMTRLTRHSASPWSPTPPRYGPRPTLAPPSPPSVPTVTPWPTKTQRT